MSSSRLFTYYTGSQLAGTAKFGNLTVATTRKKDNSNYGGVRWWNGPEEDNAYIIAYSRDDLQQPGFRRSSSKDDVSFLNLVNSLPARQNEQPFTDPNIAKVWLNNNNYWTSYSGYPEGLILYLDSANPASYPGTGSTWSDTTGNSNNATLFNSPTFSSNFDGILQFDDASAEYATIPDIGNLSQWTVEAWFRLTTSLTGKVTSVISNEYDLVSKLNFSIGTNNMPTNANLAVGFFDGAWRTTAGFVPSINTWYQVVGTYDGTTINQYVNGIASGGSLTYSGTPQSGGEIRLMRRWDGTATQTNLVDGDLAIVKIYNSALSPSSILENYNQYKTRFSLVIHYDPVDSSSYPGSGTTLFSLISPQFNGTIVNSPTYSSSGGGYFDFNGTNQYVTTPYNVAYRPTAEITLEQWLSPDSWNIGSGYKTSLSCTQGGGWSYNLFAGETFSSYIRANGVYQAPQVDVSGFSGWHHFVTTFDGRYTKLYVDGVLEDTVDIGSDGNLIQYAVNNSMIIGAEAGSTTTADGNYWDGKISLTRIYTSALTSTEVLQNFNSTKSRFGF